MSETIPNETNSNVGYYASRKRYVACDKVKCDERGAVVGRRGCVLHHATSDFTVEEHYEMRASIDSMSPWHSVNDTASRLTTTGSVWHVVGKSVVTTPSRPIPPYGFCYLLMIKWRYRDHVASLLGQSPTFGRLLNLSVSYIETMRKVSSMSVRGPRGDVIGLRDALYYVAKSPGVRWDEGSFGKALFGGAYVASLDVVLDATHCLGACDEELERSYDPGQPDYGIEPDYVPPMSVAVADDVFADALEAWGFVWSERDAVIDAIIPLLCFGTSNRIKYDSVQFVYRGCERSLEALRRAAARHVVTGSPIRKWVVSYMAGRLCHRIMMYLRHNKNSFPAMYNAARYHTYGLLADLSFDCSYVLRHLLGQAARVRRALRVVRTLKFVGTLPAKSAK